MDIVLLYGYSVTGVWGYRVYDCVCGVWGYRVYDCVCGVWGYGIDDWVCGGYMDIGWIIGCVWGMGIWNR